MQSGNEIWPVYAILQNNFFIKKFYEKCGLETSSRPFLIFRESSVKLQKFHLLIEVMLYSLQTQKGLELVFRLQFL